SRERIPIHHRLGTTASFFKPALFLGRHAFPPVLTLLQAGYFAVFPNEPGVFALAAGRLAGEYASGVNGDDAGAVVAAAAVFALEDSMESGVCWLGYM
ncbi:hypothetical protein ACHAW6_000951, partial [Cyclotella cf. meneghiniana]